LNILEQNMEAIHDLCVKHKVKELYAFGSVLDEKKFNEESYVDLLVEFEEIEDPLIAGENYWNILESLENVFKRHVDLVSSRYLRIRFFIKRIQETKKLLYAA
jgi:uncharacterized protein